MGLLIAVFCLTLSALYGLGMMLASLFLLWGREAFHMTQLVIEPVYFVSGLNFPVGRLGALGALAIATIPFAVGLDAMRQLVFAGPAVHHRHAVARGRGADPRRDDGRVHAARALDDPADRADGPQRAAACRCAGNDDAPRSPSRHAWPTPFDPARTEGARARRHGPQACARRCSSAGGSRRTGPTRSCS